MKEILEVGPISRIRRNHGLEHATIHVLTRSHPNTPIAGHSDTGGFWLLGEVETEEVAHAVTEALSRLQNGEHKLAVHPNCGTNYVAKGAAAGLASFLALGGTKRWKDRFERLPLVILFSTMALILSEPLGLRLQELISTSGDPGGLMVTEVIKNKQGQVTMHRVITRG